MRHLRVIALVGFWPVLAWGLWALGHPYMSMMICGMAVQNFWLIGLAAADIGPLTVREPAQ